MCGTWACLCVSVLVYVCMVCLFVNMYCFAVWCPFVCGLFGVIEW